MIRLNTIGVVLLLPSFGLSILNLMINFFLLDKSNVLNFFIIVIYFVCAIYCFSFSSKKNNYSTYKFVFFASALFTFEYMIFLENYFSALSLIVAVLIIGYCKKLLKVISLLDAVLIVISIVLASVFCEIITQSLLK